MTIDEKRETLVAYCDTRTCNFCRLQGTDCAFENGTPEQIESYYAVVFGGNQPDAPDMVNSPKHYSLPGDMEVIDVEIATQGVEAVKEHCVCAAIEYLLRHKRKNGDEDVKKAHWWLSKYVEISTEKETK